MNVGVNQPLLEFKMMNRLAKIFSAAKGHCLLRYFSAVN